MLALYRSDRQADALAAARRARVRLVEDLGVDPGPALARMEQAVLIQADELLLPLPGPIDGAATGVPGPTRSVVTAARTGASPCTSRWTPACSTAGAQRSVR